MQQLINIRVLSAFHAWHEMFSPRLKTPVSPGIAGSVGLGDSTTTVLRGICTPLLPASHTAPLSSNMHGHSSHRRPPRSAPKNHPRRLPAISAVGDAESMMQALSQFKKHDSDWQSKVQGVKSKSYRMKMTSAMNNHRNIWIEQWETLKMKRYDSYRGSIIGWWERI